MNNKQQLEQFGVHYLRPTSLRESEDRHRRISAVMSDIAYSCTKLPCTAYSIDWITGATERVLGYSADELKTLKCWRSIVVQEDLPTFDMNVIGIPPNASRSCELRMRRKTGEEIWVSSLVECVMDLDSPDGLRLYGGLIDITERKKLEGQLLQAQKMEAIGTLAAGIAHDFNNMLQVIVGYTDLLLLEKKEGDPGYEELQKIIKTSYDARDLVQKIRLVSRKADIKQVPCELNHRVKEVSELLSQTLPRTINLHVHLTENLATIEADPALMNQMVMNLGINAGEAMSEGGTLTIKTENKALDNDFCRKHPGLEPGLHVLLTISDTGKGIAPEHLDRLFDPFYSTKVRDYHKGTGLGLPVVRGIVEMHKGFIDVESEVGRGTTFRVYLPLMKVVKAPEKVEEIQPPPRGTETILLVEDEELVRNLGVYALEQFGYKVLAVGDGQEALEVYEREKENISLVILDIIMPRMDGKQCFRELLRMNPNIRVLISSGIIQRELIHEVVNLGAKGSLVKPFDVRDLLLKVREVIDTD
ncbi:MAG: two-component system, cell cycle sensor histidine kinase and response regulator CckA [Thermodesulfobacteriota bacterium]|nr:two-component system, cell cycle sensor histidine kinase and response regulator CckA [Thermodesulfobacteriota bacterium]